jgi:phosphatidylglycerol lysyltransferase
LTTSTIPAVEPHRRVLTALRQHGWNATSFQVLEPDFCHWFTEDGRCVAYVDTGTAWVAAGAPLARDDELAATAGDFMAAARRAGRRVCFFATEERFVQRAAMPSLLIGEQPSWDPGRWPDALACSRSLREQIRRARAKGVKVRRLSREEVSDGAPARRAIESLIDRWHGRRPMPPLGFLVQVHPFAQVDERRLYVAEREGGLLAFLGAVPVYARQGWLFEDLIRDPGAPNGSVELLVDHAMRACAAEGSRYVTLGLSPLSGAVPHWLGSARVWGAGFFDFAGLRAFKAKMQPAEWSAIYLCYPPGRSALRALLDALAAFARGRLLHFGVRTMLRGPAVLIRLLSLLLLPWTVLLALPLARPYFPSATVQGAWVVFDLGLVFGLFALMRRWRHGLARVLAATITADAVVTLAQAMLFNLPRLRGLADAVLVSLAVSGPALAALLLWGAYRRSSRGFLA